MLKYLKYTALAVVVLGAVGYAQHQFHFLPFYVFSDVEINDLLGQAVQYGAALGQASCGRPS